MSTIMSFINSLVPRIKKSVVQKDLDATIKELSDFTIPMAVEMANQYRLVPFRSEFYSNFTAMLNDRVKFEKKSDNVWLNLVTALNIVNGNAAELKTMIDNYMQEDTITDGISAKAAHMLRIAGSMSFISSYVTEAANYTLAMEAVKLGDEDSTAPAQAAYINNNIDRFARLLSDCAIPLKEFKILFGDIPDVFLSNKSQSTVMAMFTPKQLDPFKNHAGMSRWTGSPIYSIRMAWETYQAERFHAAKERKAMLVLRLIHLQNRQNDENNPRLQREIEGLETRIRKYEQQIRKVEESIGL